jgi:hypothetical protein
MRPAASTVAPSPIAAPLPRRDLLDTLHALGRFRVLLRLLARAGLAVDLGERSPLTLFAPTDQAFAELAGGAEALLDPEQEEALIDRLEYHLVRGRLELDEALAVGAARSLQREELHFRVDDGAVYVDGARVIGDKVACENGLLHVVDAVLRPASMALADRVELKRSPAKPPAPLERRSPREPAAPRASTRRIDLDRPSASRLPPRHPLRAPEARLGSPRGGAPHAAASLAGPRLSSSRRASRALRPR